MGEFSEDVERGSEHPVRGDHCPRCDAPVADTADKCRECGLEL